LSEENPKKVLFGVKSQEKSMDEVIKAINHLKFGG